ACRRLLPATTRLTAVMGAPVRPFPRPHPLSAPRSHRADGLCPCCGCAAGFRPAVEVASTRVRLPVWARHADPRNGGVVPGHPGAWASGRERNTNELARPLPTAASRTQSDPFDRVRGDRLSASVHLEARAGGLRVA